MQWYRGMVVRSGILKTSLYIWIYIFSSSRDRWSLEIHKRELQQKASFPVVDISIHNKIVDCMVVDAAKLKYMY